MTNTKHQTETVFKKRRALFKITTGIAIIGMLGGGASQLFRAEYQVQVFQQLGYPLYVMSITGLGKIIGAIILCIPKLPPIFKIGAYAGLLFVTTGAVISHLVHGEAVNALSPLIVAGIAVAACLLNPTLNFAFQRPVSN